MLDAKNFMNSHDNIAEQISRETVHFIFSVILKNSCNTDVPEMLKIHLMFSVDRALNR